MFKKIDFTKIGGFPLKQDVLGFMQGTYEDLAKMIVDFHDLPSTGNFIVAGGRLTGSDISAGWIVVDGLLLPLQAGTGTHIELVEVITPVNYNDGNTHPSIVTKFARPTNTTAGNIAYTAFTRAQVITSRENREVVVTLTRTTGNKSARFYRSGRVVTCSIEAGWRYDTGAAFVGVPVEFRPSVNQVVALPSLPDVSGYYALTPVAMVVVTSGEMRPATAADGDHDFAHAVTFTYLI